MAHVLIAAEAAYQLRTVAWLIFGEGHTLRASFIAGTCGSPAFQVPAVRGSALMTAPTHSTALATIQPAFTDTERLALAGFLAGYRGLTREAYPLDLRQSLAGARHCRFLLSVRRADIETFARELEARGWARATVTRPLAVGARAVEPLFLTGDGRRLDRHGAARIVCRVTRRAGIAGHVSPHTLRHAFITAALDAGVPLRDVQEAASHVGGWTVGAWLEGCSPGWAGSGRASAGRG